MNPQRTLSVASGPDPSVPPPRSSRRNTTTLTAMSAIVTHGVRSVGMLSLSGNTRRGRLPGVPLATPEERAACGRALRADVPRSAHAELPPRPAGVDPVALLAGEARSRLPDLVPVRHGRMLASPLAFLRGAPAIMAADLAATPATGLRVQLCGDAHVSNFGVLGAPDGRPVLDVDELDETLRGPWEWDVKRLAASLVVAARGAGWEGTAGRGLAAAAAGGYRDALRDLAASGELEAWDARRPVEDLQGRLEDDLERKGARWLRREADPARAREGADALRALCDVVDGVPRLRPSAPLVLPLDGLDALEEVLTAYAAALPPDRRELLGRFRLVQVARTAAGVARVGTPSFVALLVGRDGGDPLFLGVREARASALEPWAGAEPVTDQGARVVAGARLVHAVGDGFLGHVAPAPGGAGRALVVRRLREWRGAFVPAALRPATLQRYAGACGWTLARAHARSGDRVALAAYLGKGDAFDRAVASFAEAYADRAEADWAALDAAVREGRLPAAFWT